ncbi:MAG: type II toxin-antitoxin system RelE/ParE family toxin [bacterium]
MKLRWSKRAAANLDSIYDYIAQDSEPTAYAFIKALAESAGKLTDFPFLGRFVPESQREDVRELLFGEYRIIYRVEADTVWVLTVIHGRRLLNLELTP